MDKTTFADKEFLGHEHECGIQSDMGGADIDHSDMDKPNSERAKRKRA